jgi:hypothetical protein
VFVIDPWSLPAVAANVPRPLPHGPLPGLAPAVRLLEDVAERRWRTPGARHGAPIRTPVAIVASKADLLRQAAEATGAVPPFLPDRDGAQAPAWTPEVGADVERFIASLGGGPLLDAARRFERRSYHAAAPTGRRPTTAGIYPHLAPYGCLEPLRWVLHEMGLRAA